MPAPLGFMFNPMEVAPTAPIGAFPAGWYNFVISGASIRPVASDASQSQLELTFTVEGGTYSGRKAWAYYQLWDPDESKRGRAQSDISAVCHAARFFDTFDDAEKLLGRKVQAEAKLKDSTNPKYPEPKNVLRNFRSYGPLPEAPATTAPAPAAASPVATAPGFAPKAPTLPQAPASFAQAPAPLAPPPAMPQGFALPGQQTAPQFAPPAAPAPAYAPPAPGFAPPAPPSGMPVAPAWGTVPQG